MEKNESIISFSCCRLGYMKITCRDWERRKMIFNKLVKQVASWGVYIFHLQSISLIRLSLFSGILFSLPSCEKY